MDLNKMMGVLILCGVVTLIICIRCRDVFDGKGVPVTFFTYLVLTAIPFVLIVAVWYALTLIFG